MTDHDEPRAGDPQDTQPEDALQELKVMLEEMDAKLAKLLLLHGLTTPRAAHLPPPRRHDPGGM